MNNQKNEESRMKKEERTRVLSSFVSLRWLSSVRKQKYLAWFAPFCEHKKKRHDQTFLLISVNDKPKVLPICRRKACKRPFCLLAACLWLANIREICKYRQDKRKTLKTPKNRAYRSFSVNHPPGHRPTR